MERKVFSIAAEVPKVGINEMIVGYVRPFSASPYLYITIGLSTFSGSTGHKTDTFGFPDDYQRFKRRFELYLSIYFFECWDDVRDKAASCYRAIEQTHKDSDPFVTVIVD